MKRDATEKRLEEYADVAAEIFMQDASRPIRHVEAFLDVMEAIGTRKRYRQIRETILEKGKKEEITMWSIEEEIEKRGMERGSDLKLIALICRKLRKGKDAEQIADELEEELDVVEHICEVARGFAPEYDINKIYEALRIQVA